MGVPMDSSGATETGQNEQKCLQFKQNTQGHCKSWDAAALLALKQLSTTQRKYMIWCRIIKAGGIGQGNSEMCYSSSNLLGNSTREETVGAICSGNILWVFKPILKTFKATARLPHSGTRLILARDQVMWQSEDVSSGDMQISYSTWWSAGPLYPVAKANWGNDLKQKLKTWGQVRQKLITKDLMRTRTILNLTRARVKIRMSE